MRAIVMFVLGAALGVAPSFAQASQPAQPPQRLSETGLFVAGSPEHVRADILSYSPQYPLWSDGAHKRRWIYLPPGSAIDASNPDAWEFPRGTRLWKDFAQGRSIETRYLERLADGTWRFAAYRWNEQGTDAELVSPFGAAMTLQSGYRYQIPGIEDCRACHEGSAVPVLGFSLLQLSSDRDPLAPHAEALAPGDVDLRGLLVRGFIKNLPQAFIEHAPRIAAATPTERAALGYLHGNCGHCHNDLGSLASLELSLAQTSSNASSDATPNNTLHSLVGTASRFRQRGITERVVPGNAAASALVVRMRSRNPYTQMPPLGTSLMDDSAVALIECWIDHELITQAENQP